MTWLAVPVPVLDALAEQLPRIAAEESLRLASAVALGSGSLNPEDRQRLLRDWQRLAGGARVLRRASRQEFRSAVEALGIELVEEPKP